MEEINGANAAVYADYANDKVVSRFYDPDTGEMVVELHLDPEVAREYAATLTAASIDVEEHQR